MALFHLCLTSHPPLDQKEKEKRLTYVKILFQMVIDDFNDTSKSTQRKEGR